MKLLLALSLAVTAHAADAVPRPQPIGYAPSPTATSVSVKWFAYAVYLESKLAAAPTSSPSLQTIIDKLDALAARPSISVSISNSRVSLIATADGAPAPTFQWIKDGTDIPGATTNTLQVQSGTAASYAVRATNSAGTATSQIIVVTAP